MALAEFSLIDRIRARTAARADIALGIGDDAALLQPQAGLQLVVTADTLNSGVHFPAETPAYDIGWKTLAVNLSDLAPMGARPSWCVLALSLPGADPAWVDAFADGFFALADAHDIVLIGGDTTRGPLSLSGTAMGQVGAGSARGLVDALLLRQPGARDPQPSARPGRGAAVHRRLLHHQYLEALVGRGHRSRHARCAGADDEYVVLSFLLAH